MQHALPSVDVAWRGGGDRGGYVEIHFDMRDFRGIATGVAFDQEDGRCVIRIQPNTDPIPEDWVGEGLQNLVGE